MAEQAAPARNARRVVVGVVNSDKMDKTVKVTVVRQMKHPVYDKRMRRKASYTVHDEKNEARHGDTVEIMETRKLSRTKCWRLVRVLKRAE